MRVVLGVAILRATMLVLDLVLALIVEGEGGSKASFVRGHCTHEQNTLCSGVAITPPLPYCLISSFHM